MLLRIKIIGDVIDVCVYKQLFESFWLLPTIDPVLKKLIIKQLYSLKKYYITHLECIRIKQEINGNIIILLILRILLHDLYYEYYYITYITNIIILLILRILLHDLYYEYYYMTYITNIITLLILRILLYYLYYEYYYMTYITNIIT